MNIKREVAQFASDKILNKAHLGRVIKWVRGENVPPITVEIDMTNICPHRCPGCAGGMEQEAACLPNPKRIVDEILSLGSKGITFTGGGEPLVDKRTPEIVEYAAQKLDVGFITNGGLIDRENAKVLVDNCVWVRVSLDASNSEDYKKTHGMPKEEFYKVIKNISLLVKAKKESGSDCTIGVGYLTNKSMLTGMEEATIICKGLRVDYIQFRPFHYDRTPIDEQLEKCLRHEEGNSKVLWSKHKYEAMKYGSGRRDYGKCYGHQFAAVIGADGKMYVCCHMRGIRKYVLGDTNEHSIQEIWDSKKRQAVVDNIDFKDCPPMCRCNTFNSILWQIKKSKEHVNFL